MTDYDNFKKMLTDVGQVFEIFHDASEGEIEIDFTATDMEENVVFVFDRSGNIKEIY